MERQPAIELVMALLTAGRRADVARLTELYADDAVAVSPLFGEVRGAAAIAATWQRLSQTQPDFSAELTHILADGDRVAVLGTVAATDRAGWFGLPPTGGPIGYKIVLLFTVADGRIVRDERIYDSAGVLERLEKARLDKELRTAADVQRTLLSRTAHATRWSETVGSSVPCRATGGDFFAFVDLPADAVGILLGDVSGKGPAAALLAAMLQGMFETEAAASGGPAEALTRINRRLAARHLESRYATMTYGVLSSDGRLVYANAGHNPPALITRQGVRRLTCGGPAVGMFEASFFEEDQLRLADGDTLVLFTDGVTEARNRRDEEY